MTESQRPPMSSDLIRSTVPGLAEYTENVLFGDLWQRSGLSPRDRSLVTITTLIAVGQVQQLQFHLRRALDNGVTRQEIEEVITHLAFYAGWPRAVSAVAVAREIFDERGLADKGA